MFKYGWDYFFADEVTLNTFAPQTYSKYLKKAKGPMEVPEELLHFCGDDKDCQNSSGKNDQRNRHKTLKASQIPKQKSQRQCQRN